MMLKLFGLLLVLKKILLLFLTPIFITILRSVGMSPSVKYLITIFTRCSSTFRKHPYLLIYHLFITPLTLNVSKESILNILNNLNIHKGTGSDELPPLLKTVLDLYKNHCISFLITLLLMKFLLMLGKKLLLFQSSKKLNFLFRIHSKNIIK